jgi:hypothetical protein
MLRFASVRPVPAVRLVLSTRALGCTTQEAEVWMWMECVYSSTVTLWSGPEVEVPTASYLSTMVRCPIVRDFSGLRHGFRHNDRSASRSDLI